MSAISLDTPGHFTTVPSPLSEPSIGEARVRIRRIGVCGTDIHAFHGRQPFFEYPRILGHELAAEIISLNGDSELSIGDLVSVEPYLNNPNSPASKLGKTNCCEDLQVLGVHCDGGMRPEINIPIEKLLPSTSASADQLALVEMLGIGRHAVGRSQVNEADSVLILGAGPIGLSILTFLQLHTSDIAVADLSESRLAFCRDGFGVEKTIQVNPENDLEQSLREPFGGKLPTVIFDATGSQHSMAATFPWIAHGGRIVLVGLFQGELSFDDPNFHRREISLLASRNATNAELHDVITQIENGRIDTSPWITHRLALGDIPNKFGKTVADATLRKAIIELDG
jgi:2-desacetyl-2-hydroxyethyl bacteriochlorophyllide A dehydrogenase